MKSTPLAALVGSLVIASAAVPAMAMAHAPAPAAHAGEMLITADGAHLARVYRVNADGSVQVILDYNTVTIPASTLSMKNGELTTSLTRKQVRALR